VEIFPRALVGATYYPRAEITNAATGAVYKLPITNCQAIFMIDIATCRPFMDGTTEFYYGADDVAGTTPAINGWVQPAYLAWAGSYIVDLASGCTPDINLQWIGISRSDGAGNPVMTEIYSSGNRTASFTITGYTLNMDSQEMTDVVTSPFP
jgi:hypothetical protein